MFSRRGQRPAEDPSVAAVEDVLHRAASRSSVEPERRHGRLVVSHAVWLCACETQYESPVWLVYAVGEDGIGWQRVRAWTSESDIVDAESSTGGHPAPENVLAWLHGDWPDPWDGHGAFPEDAFIYQELQRRIIRSK